jgi:hypothetical protein
MVVEVYRLNMRGLILAGGYEGDVFLFEVRESYDFCQYPSAIVLGNDELRCLMVSSRFL